MTFVKRYQWRKEQLLYKPIGTKWRWNKDTGMTQYETKQKDRNAEVWVINIDQKLVWREYLLVIALASKPDDLSLITRSYTVGENRPLCVVIWHVCTDTYSLLENKINVIIIFLKTERENKGIFLVTWVKKDFSIKKFSKEYLYS